MYQASVQGETTRIKPKSRLAAKPFVKWVGGKRSLLPQLKEYMPDDFRDYYEPFVGGGAFFFELTANGRLEGKNVQLSDMNFDLVNTYQVIKAGVEPLIRQLEIHAANHCKEYYYNIRSQHELDERVAIAARLIYLNRTCYNGLWRVNRKGEFNVPMGSYKNPSICHSGNLSACHAVLRSVNIRLNDFRRIEAGEGDFVYFDPPYHPLDEGSFTSYYKHEFGRNEQIALRDFCEQLKKRGVKVMVSNSDTKFVRELYSDFTRHTVQAPRMVNSDSNGRGSVNELIVTNY